MAGPNPVVRPLASADAKRVCTLSGVQGKIYSEKLVKLKDLEQTLLISIKDAETAIKSEAFWTKAIISVKIVKLVCDLTVDIASGATGPGGKAVSLMYERAGLVVDGLNGDLDSNELLQHAGEIHVDAFSESLAYMDKTKTGSVVSAAKTLFKTAQSVYSVYQDYASLKTVGQGTAGARKTLLTQLYRVREQVAAVEKALSDCGLE